MVYDVAMPEILKETTKWNCEFSQPNHTYLLGDSGRIIAYAPFGGDEIVVMKTQLKIDKRYRTFVKTTHVRLSNILSKQKTEPGVRKFKVKSKDKEYTVTVRKSNYSCTCLGFSFRGKCKHSDAVAKKLQAA